MGSIIQSIGWPGLENRSQMNERLGLSCLFILGRILRGGHWLKISLRRRTKFKNLTTPAIPFDAKQDLILCISALPAGAFWVKIGGTTRIDVFRTAKKNPAGRFAVPET
jgi:hypothetical protein